MKLLWLTKVLSDPLIPASFHGIGLISEEPGFGSTPIVAVCVPMVDLDDVLTWESVTVCL